MNITVTIKLFEGIKVIQVPVKKEYCLNGISFVLTRPVIIESNGDLQIGTEGWTIRDKITGFVIVGGNSIKEAFHKLKVTCENPMFEQSYSNLIINRYLSEKE